MNDIPELAAVEGIDPAEARRLCVQEEDRLRALHKTLRCNPALYEASVALLDAADAALRAARSLAADPPGRTGARTAGRTGGRADAASPAG